MRQIKTLSISGGGFRYDIMFLCNRLCRREYTKKYHMRKPLLSWRRNMVSRSLWPSLMQNPQISCQMMKLSSGSMRWKQYWLTARKLYKKTMQLPMLHGKTLLSRSRLRRRSQVAGWQHEGCLHGVLLSGYRLCLSICLHDSVLRKGKPCLQQFCGQIPLGIAYQQQKQPLFWFCGQMETDKFKYNPYWRRQNILCPILGWPDGNPLGRYLSNSSHEQ